MVVGRRVLLLASCVGFRVAHAIAAHWQVVAGTVPDLGLLREILIGEHAR